MAVSFGRPGRSLVLPERASGNRDVPCGTVSCRPPASRAWPGQSHRPMEHSSFLLEKHAVQTINVYGKSRGRSPVPLSESECNDGVPVRPVEVANGSHESKKTRKRGRFGAGREEGGAQTREAHPVRANRRKPARCHGWCGAALRRSGPNGCCSNVRMIKGPGANSTLPAPRFGGRRE
jgi:hypothetical protein